MPIYIFDLDLTISKKDTYIPFLLHCLKKNKKPIIHFPYLLLSVFFYYINFIDNTELKKRFLSAFLGGKKIGDFKYIINCFVDKILKDGLHNDAIIKINQILKEGHLIVLATASLDIYVNEIGRRLSFSKIFSTKVEINKFRKISGNLKIPKLRSQKRKKMDEDVRRKMRLSKKKRKRKKEHCKLN